MASTIFTDNTSVIYASWLNDVNEGVYTTLPLKANTTDVNTALGLKADTTALTDYLPLAGGTITGGLNISSLVKFNAGADVASASTVDLTAATGNTVRITGTTAITAFIMNAGQQMELVAVGALPLTYHATTMNINGGASYTCAAGDRLSVFKDGAGVIQVNVIKQDGTAVASSVVTDKIQSITSSVASNELTVTLNPTVLDFRDATLSSGAVNTRVISSAISCVVPSTATLGTVNAQQSRIVVLAIDNAGTVELAVVNIAGGNDLSETGVISTTALSATADSNNVIYSTTERTNVPYRVVGYVESTQATAGTWATAPSKIQGYGGQASSLLPLRYTSAAQTITSAGLLTLAHGLGVKPNIVIATAICTTADSGYSIGDEVFISTSPIGTAGGNYGISVYIDVTNVYVRFSSAATALLVFNKGTGVASGLTNTSWKLYIKAGL